MMLLLMLFYINRSLGLLYSRLCWWIDWIRKPYFTSTVRDVVHFNFINSPSWRDGREDIPNVEEMIDQIISFQKSWNTLKRTIAADTLENIRRKFTKKYCDGNTDPLEESGLERKEQASQNVGKLLEYFDELLLQEKKRSQLGCCGLIEKSVVQEAHKIAVCGDEIKDGCTKPGEFSNLPRFTTHYSFEEEYRYRDPEDMDDAVDLILDRFNSLLTDACSKSDDRERLRGIFKSLSWFLFEILDLHPFGNGNGRVFRIFCHYVLFSCGVTAVPSPIYNVCSNTENNDHSTCGKPCKDTYEHSLINARKSVTRHPEELATMLMETCWNTWHELMDDINKG